VKPEDNNGFYKVLSLFQWMGFLCNERDYLLDRYKYGKGYLTTEIGEVIRVKYVDNTDYSFEITNMSTGEIVVGSSSNCEIAVRTQKGYLTKVGIYEEEEML